MVAGVLALGAADVRRRPISAVLLPLSGDAQRSVRRGLPCPGVFCVADRRRRVVAGDVTASRYSSAESRAAQSGAGSRYGPQAMLPLFVAAMLLVPAAANVTTFLVLWELMALSSLVLVLAEHRLRRRCVTPGSGTRAMTHAGWSAILLGLVLFAVEGRAVNRSPRCATAHDLSAGYPIGDLPAGPGRDSGRRPASCRCTCGCRVRIRRRPVTCRR